MQLTSPSKTSDPLGCYYTTPAVGALLVKAVRLECPSTIMDICVGDGALITEAAKIWRNASFFTVDIKEKSTPNLNKYLSGRIVTHHVGDSLDLELATRLGVQWGKADIALCNPPYIRPKWKEHFLEILEDAGLSHVLPKMRNTPADLLFIAQNLRLLRKGGRLGLILPDGLISGENYSLFRKTLLEKHQIERVIELPRRIFRKTEAKAHIVIVSKDSRCSDFISIQRLEQDGKLSTKLYVTTDNASKRLDYSYNYQAQKSDLTGQKRIRDIVINVFRGTHASSDIKNAGFPVFHTRDFKNDNLFVPSEFYLPPKSIEYANKKIAIPGDILVARVGRNLTKKVCMVINGMIAVSDCILILRVLPEYRQSVFSYLRSESGQTSLEAITHGVGAKFITPNALAELVFEDPIEADDK